MKAPSCSVSGIFLSLLFDPTTTQHLISFAFFLTDFRERPKVVIPVRVEKAFRSKMVNHSLMFSCKVSKTKAITLANHKALTKSIEPIKIQFKYVKLMPSAGKRVRASHLWSSVYFWLDDKTARVFKVNLRSWCVVQKYSRQLLKQ